MVSCLVIFSWGVGPGRQPQTAQILGSRGLPGGSRRGPGGVPRGSRGGPVESRGVQGASRSDPGGPGGVSGESWARPGGVLGRSWGGPGGSWGVLGGSRAVLGAFPGGLVASLDRLGRIPAESTETYKKPRKIHYFWGPGRVLGRSRRHLGASGRRLEASWRPLGRVLAHLGRKTGRSSQLGGLLEASWTRLGGLLERSRGPGGRNWEKMILGPARQRPSFWPILRPPGTKNAGGLAKNASPTGSGFRGAP